MYEGPHASPEAKEVIHGAYVLFQKDLSHIERMFIGDSFIGLGWRGDGLEIVFPSNPAVTERLEVGKEGFLLDHDTLLGRSDGYGNSIDCGGQKMSGGIVFHALQRDKSGVGYYIEFFDVSGVFFDHNSIRKTNLPSPEALPEDTQPIPIHFDANPIHLSSEIQQIINTLVPYITTEHPDIHCGAEGSIVAIRSAYQKATQGVPLSMYDFIPITRAMGTRQHVMQILAPQLLSHDQHP